MCNNSTFHFKSRMHTHLGNKANALATQHRVVFGHTTFRSPQMDSLPLETGCKKLGA